ncbi:MAG: DUF354 domain-containing protein [Candidatus Baldrarchaeia archaeon]
MRKKVWIDAVDGKYARYSPLIKKVLEKEGFEVIITSRDHPDTIPMMKYLGERFYIIGQWSYSKSPKEKLKASLERQLELMEFIEGVNPDLFISFPSVEGSRVAFGLGIPILCVPDTPHAYHVCKLSIPLSDRLLTTEAIPKKEFSKYGIDENKILQFRAVDEYAWMKDYKPNPKFLDELDLDPEKPIVLVRQAEIKSAYYPAEHDPLFEVAKKLSRHAQVVYLTRLHQRVENAEGLIIPQSFIDAASLVFYADMVISVGGTITREAALIGTPGLVLEFQRIYSNEYLVTFGYPIYTFKDKVSLIKKAYEILEKGKNIRKVPRAKFEDPLKRIANEVKNMLCK